MKIIEKTILSWLQEAAIDGILDNVFCETPTDPPDEYILIQRTGSYAKDKIYTAMVAVQAISNDSLFRAAEIDEAVIEAMEAFGEGSAEVYSCILNASSNFTNTNTKQYRYQSTFDICF